ncbi:hypothetical protein C7U92_30260 [Bradyrhizobium sp. WBOS7]|uniref:Uncharacterized protein n=1 Tax=Bradyrhizobium betae TaxID=244734 RepID=A0AAE9SXP2_9BRAD|nr:hypothetical protein [Bradyrhizobium sp. WBOS2]MDD1574811.1 hypothetical protein [Bradyrhizobium sp. WBOS1]MDD1580971.1 hypothetical protein [Bradyrhizobium sp. WBOS7]MDD1604483.1 hypothetical protein [Bradyrhizobium sp. WBOS16]UUO38699.1 hypothetical protein DCK84_31655 [Bradyrhizobium sp. WBOS01]UUO44869.1 hypothetical protein DCM75_31630 [Bradyrhizobium sp. WBOS02]UUO55277.1 hypothetical protein DCM79_21225 [Bradyrhizobium sp. WBOS07]UUO69331.1 hypothetical protein DCM83_31675 [Bradyrh
MPRLDRGIQYAAAYRSTIAVSAYWIARSKPGDDSVAAMTVRVWRDATASSARFSHRTSRFRDCIFP